jgi:hypothetical protein
MHDDQHGTAIICGAGLQNAVKLVGKKMEDLKVCLLSSQNVTYCHSVSYCQCHISSQCILLSVSISLQKDLINENRL